MSFPAHSNAVRTTVAGVVALLLVVTASPATALTPAPDHLPQTLRVDTTPQKIDLTFPVADPATTTYPDTFLALRDGGSRLHAATDVMAPKHRAVHAAVGGKITFAPADEPSYGWMLSIFGDDGRRYSYVHLNNDTPERDPAGAWLDDDQGGLDHAYAPRIVEEIRTTGSARGLRVERGELIGWLGDSGNAKGIASHLHFEIHMSDDDGEYRINPYHSLVAAAESGDVPSADGATDDNGGDDGDGDGDGAAATAKLAGYTDVTDDGAHSPAIVRLTEENIVFGCRTDRYCPHDAVTRGDLANFLATALDLPDSDDLRFHDVDGDSRNAGAIGAVDASGVLRGYDDERFGPDDPLSRAQLATVLVQGFDLPDAAEDAPFDDVHPDGTHTANIAAAFEAGLTDGCDDGSRYCGGTSVTRGQIASFLVDAIDGMA